MLKRTMVHLVKQVEHLDDGKEITITGSVPMVEGLDVGVGYYTQDGTAAVTTGNTDKMKVLHTLSTQLVQYLLVTKKVL